MLDYFKGYWIGFLEMDRTEKSITIGMLLFIVLFTCTTV